MKELCSCNCCAAPHAGYVTPWCSLLKGHDDSCAVLHLWYKMDILREEARKRLAYLGAANNYQNVPDVNDLVGGEDLNVTPRELTLQYNAVNDILSGVLKRIAYLGKTTNYENVPYIGDFSGILPSSSVASHDSIHLYITKEELKEAIQQRTAYLGKFRRTEEAQHLLDLIAITDDEDSLFEKLAKEAMTDVWKILSAPFNAASKLVEWRETAPNIGVHYQLDVDVLLTDKLVENLRKAVLEALVARIIHKWLALSYPTEAAAYDAMYMQALEVVKTGANDVHAINYDLYNLYLPEAVTDVWRELAAPFVGLKKNSWSITANVLSIPLGVSYRITEAEMLPLKDAVEDAIELRVIWKWLSLAYPQEAALYDTLYQQAVVKMLKCTNEFKARWSGLFIPFAKAAMADVYKVLGLYMPRHEKAYWFREGQETAVFTDDPLPDPAVTFYAGQYVEYNDELYMAIEDGSSDDFAGKLVPTEDYRDSAHYGILWRCESNINAVEPLDTAIFEALVARIVYKWVAKAYPPEAEMYLVEYNENVEHIKDFAQMMEGPQIINRIPRMF